MPPRASCSSDAILSKPQVATSPYRSKLVNSLGLPIELMADLCNNSGSCTKLNSSPVETQLDQRAVQARGLYAAAPLLEKL